MADLRTPVLVGLGLDVVDVARFRIILERRASMRERLFTEGEKTYASTFADPAVPLAARFAAKEAVMKAMSVGLGAFDFTDVEVQRLPGGQPILALTSRAKTLAEAKGVSSWHISLTHTETVAAAVVVAMS